MLTIGQSIASHWGLIIRLARREIENRYRGSLAGIGWLVLTPLLMLLVFTFVFSAVFASQWPGVTNTKSFALVLFAGLIVFQFFSELISRAPNLFLEDKSYIKKVVFPLEVLPIVAMITAGIGSMISLALLLIAHIFMIGGLSIHVLWVPALIAPLLCLVLGLVFLFASLGVFLRDIKQVIPWMVQVLMFLGPVFYPLSRLPEWIRSLVYINPISFPIEELRTVIFLHQAPDLIGLWIYTIAAIITLGVGMATFRMLRPAFSDVV
ncbi:MAG: ABC transporter permease [Beijerinckiaceae bacterium]